MCSDDHDARDRQPEGWCVKTTTVASLGTALGDLGARVLLVDLDPQSCLTFSLGDPEQLEVSAHQVLLRQANISDVIVATDDGPDLLPATIELAGTEGALLMKPGREPALRAAFEDVLDDYDWILLDCAPTLGVLTVSALSAADRTPGWCWTRSLQRTISTW